MATQEAHARLQALHSAFATLSRADEGLSVLAGSSPDSGAAESFTMRLVGGGSPEVRLRVRVDSADLTARSGTDREHAGRGEIRDRLGVRLADGFAWDDSECASADELAGLLLKHMRRRLKAVDDVLPKGEAPGTDGQGPS
jgi:hypothetical protein